MWPPEESEEGASVHKNVLIERVFMKNVQGKDALRIMSSNPKNAPGCTWPTTGGFTFTLPPYSSLKPLC